MTKPTADDVEWGFLGYDCTTPYGADGFHVHPTGPYTGCCGTVRQRMWFFWRPRWSWRTNISGLRIVRGTSRSRTAAIQALLKAQ